MSAVTIQDLVSNLDLEVRQISSKVDSIKILSTETNRPGLQLVGYYEKFAPERIQIIGSTEWHYFNELQPDRKKMMADKFFSHDIPVVVFTRGLEIFPEMLEACIKYDRTILVSNMRTAKFVNRLVSFIEDMTAPSERVHGVLLEVFGIGVMLIGESGVGKSETALDLIIRGHRLVADDTIIVHSVDDGLKGESPELTRHFLEIRGIGILNIERLYGVGSVKGTAKVDIVVKLEEWSTIKDYDRLGLDDAFIEFLGKSVPLVTIPVKPGRHLAMIVEIAARNYRQKIIGYNAAEELNQRLINQIEMRKKENSL